MSTPEDKNAFKNSPEESVMPHEGVDFDGGTFTIPFLAADPDGFVVATNQQLTRREGHDYAAQLFTPEERERLQRSVKDEVAFQGGPKVAAARLALRTAQARPEKPASEELEALEASFDQARQRYVRGMAGKVGLRNVSAQGKTLSADVHFVSFPAFTELSKPGVSPEVADLSRLTGVAMAVRTIDNRLVIQHRAVAKQRLDNDGLSRGNRVYADIPGASVAGMLDATLDSADRSPGTPDPVDTDSVRAAILKESFEELGADLNDFAKLRIVGLAHDYVTPHDEFLLLTDARITASQLHEQSRTSTRNEKLGDADFEEKFIDIEASTEAIETLLTDVKCPLPPTHAALLVASGYSMVLAEKGVQEADSWKTNLEQQVQANYRQINNLVSRFYQRHPEVLQQVPERYWGKGVPSRDTQGYSSSYTPEEQGLPSFDDEMVRTGLAPETRRTVETAWLFDVDGPLTDPKEHKVVETELLDIIAQKLKNGEPVGLNTGREVEWAMERFVNLLSEKLDDPGSLANLVVIGEMGGTWAFFDAEGNPQYNKSKQLSVPDDLMASIRELVDGEYADAMTFADERQTMASVIMKEGYDIDAFDRRRLDLSRKLHKLVADSEAADVLKIGQTTIATDINVKYAGKDLGADRFLEWLKVQNIKPEQIMAFGDSASDIEMAEELYRRGKDVTFVFVGPSALTQPRQDGYPIIHEPGYSQATLKVLKAKK